jgi:hypothetical protein
VARPTTATSQKKRLGSDLNFGLVGNLLDEADDRPAVSTLQRLATHNHHRGLGLPFRQRALNLSAVLGIRDISPDPGLTPEPTPFFSDLKDAKNYFFFLHIFFL